MSSFICSLTLHQLHQASFPISFNNQLSNIFPNLKYLTLTSWTSESIIKFIIDDIQQMKLLEKLVIRELSCSLTVRHTDFIEKIFNIKNPFLTKIIFDYDCDSFDFTNYSITCIPCYNIIDLTIQLDTLMDFSILIHFIPNISRLDVTLKNSSLEKVPFNIKLPLLKEFSIWDIHCYSEFDDIESLLLIVPFIEQFSLTISTRDFNLIDGIKLHSILPVQLKQFNYTVCYYSHESIDYFNIDKIKESWSSVPIVYSIYEHDKRLFLHTLPYLSSRLIIRSSLARNISIKDESHIYSKIDQIQIYATSNIADTFPIIRQCRRVRELTLLAANQSVILNSSSGRLARKLIQTKNF